MGSDLVLRELPPIRTSGIGATPAEDDQQLPKPTSYIKGEETEVASVPEECVTTPRSEEHMLKPALVCPPAPRKPRSAKRKFTGPAPAPARVLHPVPDDLASVFIPLTCPESKRIRVG